MEKYFNSIDELARWAEVNQICNISIDAHKCLSVNGAVKYGLSCIASVNQSEKILRGQFNTNKYSEPHLLNSEAERLESKLRSYGFAVDRATLPV